MTSEGTRRYWLIALVGALLFLVGSGVAYQRISVIPDRIPVENCLFGADAQEFRAGMATGAFNVVGKQKHFLARYYFAVAVRGQQALGIPARQGWLNAAALPGGAFLTAAFLLLLALGQGLRMAVPGAALMASTNAMAIHYAVPETYLLTATMVLVALLTIVLVDRSGWRASMRTAAVTAAVSVAALAHLPAAAVLLVHGALEFARHPDARSGFASGERLAANGLGSGFGRYAGLAVRFAVAAAIVLFIGIAPSLFLTGTGWASDYVRDYASLSGFADGRVLVDYLATITLFALVSPFDACSCRYLAEDALRLFADPGRLLLIGAVIFGFVIGVKRIWHGRHRAFVLGLASWFAVTALFYLWFFPYEAMLPAVLFAIPLGLRLTIGLGEWRYGWIAVAALALGLAVANDPLSWPPVERFGQCCPRDRWSPWPLPPDQWLPPEQL